jgi:hypothetical protein
VAIPDHAQEPAELPNPTNRIGVASAGYRWYLSSQVLSLFGTMMSYTALFWLALHIRHGGAPAIDAAQCLPMLLFSRRAGIIVTRHRVAKVAMMTQGLQAAGALAIGFPLLAGGLRSGIWSRCHLWSAVFMVVVGAATQLFAVSATVYVQQSTPSEQRARD